MLYKIIFQVVISLVLLSCKNDNPVREAAIGAIPQKSESIEKPLVVSKIAKDSLPANLVYSFQNSENSQNLTDIIKAPKGYKRIPVKPNSFAQWLRFLPAKPPGEQVRLFNGELKPNQNVHFAIINIDVGNKDLQQCADAVMRLKAEYHYANKDFSNIHFNFTSGHTVAFDDWSKGKKPKISGNTVSFSPSGSNTDTSYPNFRKYMDMIYNYAGTASLSKELKPVAVEDMQIGDVFIQGGFPGHAVIVIDMAENESGEKIFLLAQSYMPAQDIHILKNYENHNLSPWYSLDFGEQLNTPEWTFNKDNLKRF